MPQHELIPPHFHTWDAQSQRCRGKRARSEPDADGQAGKSGLFLLLFPLVAHFLRRLPNYFPGRLCPAVPFCSGMEGSLKIRAASNGTERPRKTTARTSLWTVGSSGWGQTGFGLILAASSCPGVWLQLFSWMIWALGTACPPASLHNVLPRQGLGAVGSEQR